MKQNIQCNRCGTKVSSLLDMNRHICNNPEIQWRSTGFNKNHNNRRKH